MECNMGAAGDMLMAALLELHPDKKAFMEKMNGIGLEGVRIEEKPSVKCGITGTHVTVKIHDMEEKSMDMPSSGEADGGHGHGGEHHGHAHIHDGRHHGHGGVHDSEHHGHGGGHDDERHSHGHAHDSSNHAAHAHVHRGMEEIYRIVDKLNLPEEVKSDVKNIYRIIAEAEGRVHGRPVTEVHFHEVGMLDAVADITGCAMLIHELKADRIIASPICTGFGQVRCAHGILPVPAPATALILEGIPVYAGRQEGELCTPTGAAIVKYFAGAYERMPQMTIEKTGYGMGKKDFAAANCIRAVLGEAEGSVDEVIEFCFNIDDMTAEETGYATELFLLEGALEAFTLPAGMKKSRPGTVVSVMCRKQDRDRMAALIFRHTSTIGIREYTCRRMVLQRSERTVESSFGPVRIKESVGYGVKKEKIEYEDLKRISTHTGIPIRDIKKQIEEAD